MKNYKQAYLYHKNGASLRGIGFLLTFEQWFQIWHDSGHIDERGRSLHQYQMARYGDVGPYAVGNVRIITCAANKAEFVHTEEQKRKISEKMTGRKRFISEVTKSKMSESHIGKPMSKEHKKKWELQ